MNRPIEIVPAIKRLNLRQVGCWEHLELDFLPGLNIIAEEVSAVGKSTIFRAILYSLNPTSHLECGLTPSFGAEQGSISIEFMSAQSKALDCGCPVTNSKMNMGSLVASPCSDDSAL